ncbi:type ISP restriction/modification enzyme [Parvularcula sp. LCG005]|uniref:type ISP restriction/modification enzyme n=1 Tax=Parvularcula sp. LCG005 TaxID=3078805 RepID=UPI0029428EF7|nr:type ISP restriction/modification enzyme [Parvularcula sp. LCG005]WOI53033.1 type ISP restriction/modification enzyme [Parvularcula sp. LCG005]
MTNRSFIDSRTFDGFRRAVAGTFDEIVVVDLGGDVRANPRLSGTKHNVFGIQTGVAISFMVKRARKNRKAKPPARIRYARRPEEETAEEKLAFLAATPADRMRYSTITPSKNGYWINQVINEWDSLLPLGSKNTKRKSNRNRYDAIFKTFSLGIASNRDDWAYSRSVADARLKSQYFADNYNAGSFSEGNDYAHIKWSSELIERFNSGETFDNPQALIASINFRPFVQKVVNYDDIIVHRHYALRDVFPVPNQTGNRAICTYGVSSNHPLSTLASNRPVDLGYLKQGNGGTFAFARYRYNDEGDRIDNITDWALRKFRERYGKVATKDGIFAYCYAVLHDPDYRETYAINLKRELPRVPFYADFARWRDWGQTLLDLHVGYEEVAPYPLERIDAPNPNRAEGTSPRVILNSDRDTGTITLDADTQLTGVPDAAWDYMLGNRTAIDWVLDQHKEKKIRDETVRRLFDTYRFANHKEGVIELLRRVTSVSVRTVAIIKEMDTVGKR